jgi:hypothetical protein
MLPSVYQVGTEVFAYVLKFVSLNNGLTMDSVCNATTIVNLLFEPSLCHEHVTKPDEVGSN